MGKLKIWLRRGLCGIVFIAILAAVVFRLDRALKLIQEDNLCERYYDYPRDTFDAVFLGASFVLYGIYPMELYRDYGIASYNLATGNQSIEASYYLAKEAIEKDHPSLIVLDCNMAWDSQETMESQNIHYITDTMPYLSKNRISMIKNLSKEDEDLKPLLFPLIAYHSRWQELTYEDGLPQAKKLVYGCKVTSRLDPAVQFDDPEKVEISLPDSSVKYLQQLIDMCRETKTELLFINTPVLGKNKFFDQTGFNMRWSALQEVGEIAEKNDIPYLEYFDDWKKLGFDLDKEAMDGEHLNRWGAARFTGIIGDYITSHYNLPDRRGTGGVYDVIDRDAKEYPVNRMQESLRRSLFLRNYAATLKSDACESHGEPVKEALVLITLNGMVDNSIFTSDQAKLLQDFGIKQDLSQLEGHSWLAVIDGGKLLYETEPGEEDEADSYEGTAGKLNYTVTSGRVEEDTGKIRSGASITVNNVEYTSDNRGLHFAVFNRSTGELMDANWLNIYSMALSCNHDNH